MVVVLDVQAWEFIAIGLVLAGALLEGVAVTGRVAIAHGASKEILINGKTGGLIQVSILRAKIDDARLVELIVKVHLAPLNDAPEVDVVFAFLPTHVIGVCEIIPGENAGGIVAKTEAALHPDALDSTGRGFEGKRSGFKGRPVHCTGSRAAEETQRE